MEIMHLGKLDGKLAQICIQNALEVHEIKALIAQCVQVDEKKLFKWRFNQNQEMSPPKSI